MTELAVGERCGITIPTRSAFSTAASTPMLARVGVKRYCFEEEPQVEIRYTHEGRLRDYVFTPEPVAKADFFVNAPKFKAHPWTTVTFSMKNYIGIQDDRHRLIDHDHRLNEKIADLQYIIQPQFIAIDAIVAGEGRMLTPIAVQPEPHHHGQQPGRVRRGVLRDHRRRRRTTSTTSASRPSAASARSISRRSRSRGDVTLEEAKAARQGLRGRPRPRREVLRGHDTSPPTRARRRRPSTPTTAGAAARAPSKRRSRSSASYDKECDEKMPRMHVVFGAYDGPIDAKPGEKVVFIGDCAKWEGKVGDKLVQIESLYRDRSTKDPYVAKSRRHLRQDEDVEQKIHAARKDQVLRLEGCPVSVAEQLLALVSLGGVKNPYLDPAEAMRFNNAWMGWRAAVALKRMKGEKYQVKGACSRGGAAPEIAHKHGDAE